MVAADIVPVVDMSLDEAEAARVLKVAAVTSGFFYGVIRVLVVLQSQQAPAHLLRYMHASATQGFANGAFGAQ